MLLYHIQRSKNIGISQMTLKVGFDLIFWIVNNENHSLIMFAVFVKEGESTQLGHCNCARHSCEGNVKNLENCRSAHLLLVAEKIH